MRVLKPRFKVLRLSAIWHNWSMQSGLKYKRNQVDEAIAAVLRRDRDGAPQHVRTRINAFSIWTVCSGVRAN